jgi:hypothetical protein
MAILKKITSAVKKTSFTEQEADKENSIFKVSEEHFNTSLRGASSVESIYFLESIGNMPYLPRKIEFNLLYLLGKHFATMPINTQRNFWSYLMLECDTETYNKFLEIHSEAVKEKISPIC